MLLLNIFNFLQQVIQKKEKDKDKDKDKDEDVVVKKESKEEAETVSEEKKKEKKVKKEKKESKKNKKSKQPVGPMHFTANNEPRALDVLGDLDPSIFNEVRFVNYALIS